MTWFLALNLAERLSMIATAAFLLSRTPAFGRLSNRQLTQADKFMIIVLLGGMGIIGTYAGISIHGALANSRVVGVMVAGLLGGPFIGAGAGLIAGLHRYLLGGFTALACGLAAIAEGTLGGIVRHYYRRGAITWSVALLTGFIGETLQMAIILLIARPYSAALELVKIIAPPMLIVNSIGIAIFMVIIKTVTEEQEGIAARQAQLSLNIASQTLPFLRCGLDQQSAEQTARIIFNSIKVAAVAITDREKILAHIGLGSNHHRSGDLILTGATHEVLRTGELKLAQTRAEINCQEANCRLASTVIVPLKKKDEVIGTLKLYHTRENCITRVDLNLANGLAQLFSTQLELAEAEYQAKLRSRAELKALQAQIHPHFLFNALNTIVSLTRSNPALARALLIKLANFLRASLRHDDTPVPMEEELNHVESYLAIEGTRFGNRLHIETHIDPGAHGCLVPAFTLQPIVENALKHGLKFKKNNSRLEMTINHVENEIVAVIQDNGIGIDPEQLEKILVPGFGQGHGIGLAIVNERLKALFGPEYTIQIQSKPNQGTRIILHFPAVKPSTKEVQPDVFYSINRG